VTQAMMNWNEVIKKENKSSQIYDHYNLNPKNRTTPVTSDDLARKAEPDEETRREEARGGAEERPQNR